MVSSSPGDALTAASVQQESMHRPPEGEWMLILVAHPSSHMSLKALVYTVLF